VGAQKAGTSSLYSYMVQHPQVLPAARKEIHYFDRHYDKGLRWYRRHFPLRARLSSERLSGEASPYYLFHPHAPRRIAETLPDARILMLLRNPANRAISHYFHEARVGREKLPLRGNYSPLSAAYSSPERAI